MARPYRFTYPYSAYMDVSLLRETKTRDELVAEYNRMKTEVARRLKRLEKYKWTRESAAYRYNVNRYKGASRLNKKQISKLMRDAAEFLAAETSTVEGQRRQRDRALETWREEHGLLFLNKSNFRDWGFFVGSARNALGLQYISNGVAELQALFKIARKQHLNIEAEFGKKGVEEVSVQFMEWREKATLDPKFEKYLQEAEADRDAWSSEDYDRNPF